MRDSGTNYHTYSLQKGSEFNVYNTKSQCVLLKRNSDVNNGEGHLTPPSVGATLQRKIAKKM